MYKEVPSAISITGKCACMGQKMSRDAFMRKVPVELLAFHCPVNVQCLPKGVLTDAKLEKLAKARLCDACHWQDVKVNGTEKSISDTALEKIITMQTNAPTWQALSSFQTASSRMLKRMLLYCWQTNFDF